MAATHARPASDPAPSDPEPAGPAPSDPEPTPGAHAACPVPWCPLCVAASMVQPLHPEVLDHLIKAGTELLLALRAVVDAGTGQQGGPEGSGTGPTRLEKIELG